MLVAPSSRLNLLPMLLILPLLAVPMAASAQDNSTNSPAKTASGSLEHSHGQWRSSKMVGAAVYNDESNKIGTIDDMLIGSDGQVSNVVISLGGFLGVDSKNVEVPFSKLKFEPSQSNSATKTTSSVAAGNANDQDYSIVLPDVSKSALSSMTAFDF